MKERGGLNILDALENLNTLVDADSLDEIEVTDDDLLISHKRGGEDAIESYWVKAGPDDQTLTAVKETFRTVHDYLHTFYSKMKKGGDTKRLVEGINTIMVLVGEAAKNLDKLGMIFKQRVVEFAEYQELQNFYRNRVIKESFRAFASVPIPKEHEDILPEEKDMEDELRALLIGEEVEEVAGVHILNDLDVIKRDHLYELFYLKNEAGHNFYTYELARNIKLACDFGEFAREYFGDDPLLQIKNWEDKSLHLTAAAILKKCNRLIEKFYRESMQYKEMEIVVHVHNALMALMLAANPLNLIRQFALKGCHLYFQDFLLFLRLALLNREYQKFLLYSPPVGQPFFQVLLDLVHALCYQLYSVPPYNEELNHAIKQIVQKHKHHASKTLSENLQQAFVAMSDVLKQHPNGPVFKAVDLIREEGGHFYDPLHQGNLPERECTFTAEDKELGLVRIPSPTLQEMINQAVITEEFKTYLHALEPKECLLLINYQDRTSWKEHARSVALEDLARQAEFAEIFKMVTLAKDTDFYNQKGLYEELNNAQTFIDLFYEHLGDEATGYYFPPQIKKALFPVWINALLNQIHQTFFGSQKNLSFLDRLNFIELAYHLITLKLIELVKPANITFCSKDGLDTSASASVGFIALLAEDKKWKEKDYDTINTLLLGPTLMKRERVIHPECFDRLISLTTFLESKKTFLKDLSPLFDPTTLQWQTKI